MIRAYVTDGMSGPGVQVSVVNQRDGDTHPHEVLHVVGTENGVHHFHWQQIVPGMTFEPTLQVPADIARALLDGLTSHFEGNDDSPALRKDYDAERDRVDQLIEHLAVIAKQATAPHSLFPTSIHGAT